MKDPRLLFTFLFAALLLGFHCHLSAQCLSQPVCSAFPPTFFHTTENNSAFWKDTVFKDPSLDRYDPGKVETVRDVKGHWAGNNESFTACVQSACTNVAQGIEDVTFEISGSNPSVPPFSLFELTDQSGCIEFELPIPLVNAPKITPSGSVNPLNGPSSFDLVLLAQHLTGTQPFTENWQWVAADTDLNGLVDSADLRHCRQLQLGLADSVVYPGFRFYPLNHVFPAGNPLALPIPDFIILDSLMFNTPIEFAAIKTCDFNCNGIITGAEEIVFTSGNIGQAQPNPTTAGVFIPLQLPQPAVVAMEITDLTGRVIYRFTAPYGPGDQRLEVPAQTFPQAGLYGWWVEAGGAWRTGTVVRQ